MISHGMHNQTALTSNLHKIWDGVSLYRNVFFNNKKHIKMYFLEMDFLTTFDSIIEQIVQMGFPQ